MFDAIRIGYSCFLLILSFISIVGLLATGHQISISDIAQIKFIGEAVIFLLTGITMIKRQAFSYIVVIILLVLTQVSLIDIYRELSQDEGAFFITTVFTVLTGLTLFLVFKHIKIVKGKIMDD